MVQLTPTVPKLIPYDSVPNLETLILTGEKPKQNDLVPFLSARIENAQKIGRSMRCVIWLRDLISESRLAPIGAVGEITREGLIVGQGYIQKDVTTTGTWLNTPPWLSQEPNGNAGRSSVVFRTGDLAYYNTDSTVTIVGRLDRQLKLHGQRIGTGDVEYHVRQNLSKGDDCVVEAVAGLSAEPELTCYL